LICYSETRVVIQIKKFTVYLCFKKLIFNVFIFYHGQLKIHWAVILFV